MKLGDCFDTVLCPLEHLRGVFHEIYYQQGSSKINIQIPWLEESLILIYKNC